MIGASFLDRIYDLLYADFMRYRGGLRGWLRGTPRRLAVIAGEWYNFPVLDRPAPKRGAPPQREDPLFAAANALSRLRPAGSSVYMWCRASLKLRSPQALQEPDRIQANSKFFRGLVVVAVSFAGLFCLVPSFRANYSGSAARDFLWMASCLVLMAVAFLRYSDLRWREMQNVYRLYVILRHSEAIGLVDGAQQPEIE